MGPFCAFDKEHQDQDPPVGVKSKKTARAVGSPDPSSKGVTPEHWADFLFDLISSPLDFGERFTKKRDEEEGKEGTDGSSPLLGSEES
ncbi:hypothetical protein THAOC_36685 [Thalassiosira oceanica]|uniref:Uncharacterized protein n=1 Tax=Thalassiosira oceanica TaxID=159749 RepID=K0RE35_THAOC|nr:hypothetical protein THAOC_36685 [Thalassiosira oceanica]|eukprot:EJK44752.1 hypothetical protein THAOC_36685 [Thalassiosira oceanica]